MKEMTTIVTAEITYITQVPDEQADEFVVQDREDSTRREMEKEFRKKLNADCVVVTNVQDVVKNLEVEKNEKIYS